MNEIIYIMNILLIMKDIIDGINYWIYWYEHKIWGGSWSIFEHLCIMFLMFCMLAFGVMFVRYNIILHALSTAPLKMIPIISLCLTTCLAIYLFWGKRYKVILSQHDKFRRPKYIIWTISIVTITMICYIGPWPYLALTE